MTRDRRKPVSGPEADFIRRRVLEGLALNRAPGFHFPGYFLAIEWPHLGQDSVVEAMQPGPHCCDAAGNVHPAALGVMIDTALATAPRLVIDPGARQATVQLNVTFTGHPARGPLRMETKLEGFSAGTAVRQSLARGELYADGKPVAYGHGSFVVLPPPPSVQLAPLPWQAAERRAPSALTPEELDTSEREVYRAAEKALAAAQSDHSFIEHFWDAIPRPARDGAQCRVKIGPHLGNRVRHVQGGILFGLAALTAQAAAPRHPMLSGISAWFVSPGQGDRLAVRSKAIHAGRSFAVVRTEVRTSAGALVLEAVSHHAAVARGK